MYRFYWFKAIIENDAIRVKELMTFGYDIDAPANTKDVGPLMMHVWTERCASSTIFFDVFHPAEKLRPRAVHLAIFFSSVDVLKLLVTAGVTTIRTFVQILAHNIFAIHYTQVDFEGDVWIGSVLVDPDDADPATGRLIQNERKNRANNNDDIKAFSGGGKKNIIAFCKVI